MAARIQVHGIHRIGRLFATRVGVRRTWVQVVTRGFSVRSRVVLDVLTAEVTDGGWNHGDVSRFDDFNLVQRKTRALVTT